MKRNERPIIDLPYSSQDLAFEVAAIAGVLFTVVLIILFWATLPSSVPTHFGVAGQADAWGDKVTLLILPVVSMLLYLMLTISNRYPHKFNYLWPITAQNAREQYRLARSLLIWLKAELSILFAFLGWVMIWTALGQTQGLGVLFLPITLVVIFGTTGFYFYYAYRAR